MAAAPPLTSRVCTGCRGVQSLLFLCGCSGNASHVVSCRNVRNVANSSLLLFIIPLSPRCRSHNLCLEGGGKSVRPYGLTRPKAHAVPILNSDRPDRLDSPSRRQAPSSSSGTFDLTTQMTRRGRRPGAAGRRARGTSAPSLETSGTPTIANKGTNLSCSISPSHHASSAIDSPRELCRSRRPHATTGRRR